MMLVVKNPPTNAGLGRSPGGGYGNPLQYSCLENQSHGQRSLGDYGSEDQRVGHNLSNLTHTIASELQFQPSDIPQGNDCP